MFCLPLLSVLWQCCSKVIMVTGPGGPKQGPNTRVPVSQHRWCSCNIVHAGQTVRSYTVIHCDKLSKLHQTPLQQLVPTLHLDQAPDQTTCAYPVKLIRNLNVDMYTQMWNSIETVYHHASMDIVRSKHFNHILALVHSLGKYFVIKKDTDVGYYCF